MSRCPYCGTPISLERLVCRAHSDLPNLDPQLRRPKVQPAPVGVQPFTGRVFVGRRLAGTPFKRGL